MKVFLSHSSLDALAAAKLSEGLKSRGIEPWLADREVPVGANYAFEIYRAIADTDCVLILLTPHSLKSEHVKREVNLALSTGRRILPVALTNEPHQMINLDGEWAYWLGVVQIHQAASIDAAIEVVASALNSSSIPEAPTSPDTPTENQVGERAPHEHSLRHEAQIRSALIQIAVPDTSPESHFTPVTASDRQRPPGKSREWVRLQPPEDPFVEDRVDWILVVFEWPEGASHVQLYVSEMGRPVDPAKLPPLKRISEQDHRTFGGFRVERSRFKAGTCELHLAGCRFSEGQPKFSGTTSVTHTFPTLVRYRFDIANSFRKRRRLLTILADEDVRDAELMLTWSGQFLPLSSADRESVLLRTTLNLRRRQPVQIDLSERVPEMPQSGFVRLLCRPNNPIALIDPPIDQLRL